MNEEILKKLYDSASSVFDMPSYEQFVLDMQDDVKLSTFRNSMSEHYDMPELDQMKSDLGFSKKKEDTESPSKVGSLDFKDTATKTFFDQVDMYTGNMPVSSIVPKFLKESITQGVAGGLGTDEALKVMSEGRNVSDEDLQKLIEVNRISEEFGPTEGMLEFDKEYQKDVESGDSEIWAFVKGVAKNPKAAAEVTVSSMARMITGAFSSSEAGGLVAAGSGLGAAGGAALGSLGGPLAPATATIGAITGSVKGAMAAAGGLTETTASFVEFMQEELKGQDFTQENIRKVLEDEEAYKRMVNRSLARGATIALIDFVAAGASGQAVKGITKVGRTGKALRGLAATSIEAVGGGVGEVGARLAAGQEMDIKEIGFEMIGEVPGAAISGPLGLLSAPKYKVNGGSLSKSDMLNVIDSATDEELLSMEVKIDNDEAMADRLEVRMNRAKVAKNIDPIITDPEDIKRVTELEIKIQELKNKNTFSALKRVKVLQDEIVKIQERYEAEKEFVDGDAGGDDEEQDITVARVPMPTETVGDIINRPVTLTSLGGSPLETPIQGDLMMDGQQVVVEDSEGNITEIGNFDDIADTNISELGIEFQTAQVTANKDGSLTVEGQNYTIQEDLPTQGLVFDEEGNVTEASVKDETGKPVMFKGQVAEEIAYQVLLNKYTSPEQEQRVSEIIDKDEQLQNILRETAEPTEEEATTGAQTVAGNRLRNEPLPEATTISNKFAERSGRNQPATRGLKPLDEEKAKKIADAFDALEETADDPETIEAYEALAEETVEQYKAIVEEGYEVVMDDTEPYNNSQEMIDDLKKNKRMKIFSTEGGFGSTGITEEQRASNPMLRDSGLKDANGKPLLINDVFRFVHDFFGHAKEGNSFGPKGEEIAWQVHSQMYSDKARRAMTTETRGQNSWVNFSGVNDKAFAVRDEARALRAKAEQTNNVDEKRRLLEEAKAKVEQAYATMKFADQKIGLLPDDFVFEEVTTQEDTVEAEVNKLRELFKAPNLRKQVDNVLSSLSRLAPNVKVVVHETEDAYAEAAKEEDREQKTRGTYDPETKTIHINATSANMRTLYHEAFHAILFSRLGTDAELTAITNRMIKAVAKVLPESTKQQLEMFASNYEQSVQSEEMLAELFGILAAEYKTLPQVSQSLIKRYLDKAAKILRLKQFTDNEVIDLLNSLARKVSTGQEITQEDVNILRERSGDTVPYGSSSDKRKQKRTKPDPKKTIKAYKLFRVVESAPGQIFPLFVDANTPVEIGSWIDADMAEGYAFKGTNGSWYIPSTEYETVDEVTGKTEKRKTGQGIKIPNKKVRQELIDRGYLPEGSDAKSIVALARRPGWHSGDMPMSTHLGSFSEESRKTKLEINEKRERLWEKRGKGKSKSIKNESGNNVDTPIWKEIKKELPYPEWTKSPDIRNSNQVWAEVEMAADVDWQQEALNQAERTKAGKIKINTADITDRIPEDGYYKYKTNPQMTGSWIIGGSMKVNRILSDAEVAEINQGFGVKDLARTKPLDLAKYGFTDVKSNITSKKVTPSKTDSNGKLSEPTKKSKQNLTSRKQKVVNDTKSRVVSGSTISTSLPKENGVHSTNKFVVSLKKLESLAKENSSVEQQYIKIANEVISYGVTNTKEANDLVSARKVLNEFKELVKSNLEWLYNSFGSEVRDISKLWYDGANIVSNEIAERYNYTLDQVAGVMAVLSPQMDWFRNLSLGQRVIDIISTKQDYVVDDKMIDYIKTAKSGTGKNARPLFRNAQTIIKSIKGKKLSQLQQREQAIFVRVYDEVYNSRQYNNITPSGEINGLVRNKDGSPGNIGWGGFSTIEKAISILNDGSVENISSNMGKMHKVRNFFNNIANPNDKNAVTIDTHAVAAGMLLPLSGSSKEVVYNFGGASSVASGMTGTYGVFADAYREVAEKYGMLPREVQSITWEAVRGLFKPSFKSKKSNEQKIRDSWSQYTEGTKSLSQVQKEISEIAGGISKPVWYEYMADDNSESMDQNSAAMEQADIASRKQVNDDISEIIYRAKEEGISDEAILKFLEEVDLDVEQGRAILESRPKSTDLWERSQKAIQDRVVKKDMKYYLQKTRELFFDRQARVKKLLNGIGTKEALRAVNLIITKAGGGGFANFRFKKADAKIFKGLSEEDTKTLDQIIYARRVDSINENRQERGLDSYTGIEGYNQEDARRDLNEIESNVGSKKFKELNDKATEYFKVFDESLERLRDSGIISEEVYQQLKDVEYSPIKTIKYLIPDDYDAADIDRMAAITGMNESVIKRLSDENVNEVIMDSRWLLMTNLSMIESRVFQNRMLNAFSAAIDSAKPEDRAAIEDNILPNPKVGSFKNGRPKYKYDTVQVPKGFVRVSFLKDGNKAELIVREVYAKQLLDMKKNQGFLDKAIPKLTFTNILRFFATSGNPLFIVGNTAVDFANILFLSDVYSNNKFKGGFKLAADAVTAFFSKVGNTKNYQRIYEEFMEHGGSMDYLSTDGLKALESFKPKVKAFDAITKAAQAYGRLASYLGETSEISFRLAVYEKSKENLINEFKKNNEGRDPQGQEMEDIMFAAARESRETIDFSQGGSFVKSADKALPYLNAATQGFRKAVDYANSNPKGFASSMVQAMMMSATFSAMSMFALLRSIDDEDEDVLEILNSISDYEKANYHIIFTGEKDENGERTYVRLKKLPTIGAIGTLAEQLVIKAVMKQKGIDYDLDGSILEKNVLASLPVDPRPKAILSRNPLVSAMVTYMFNYDTFYDQQIFRGPRNKKIEPAAEGVYDSRVDQIYKDLAPLLGMSPKRTQAALEKIVTSESTNPMIGLIYSGYDMVKTPFKDGKTLVDEMDEAMKSTSKSVSKKLVRKTNKELLRYKQEAEVEKFKMEQDSKTYLAEQKVYSLIKKRYKEDKGTFTNEEFLNIIKDNFEEKDYKKYAQKYLAYIRNINSDPSILDIIYESTPEVQAKMLFNKFGTSLEQDELIQIQKVYKASGRKISKKGLAIYRQQYQK
jgi:hypothetical protein